MRALRHLTNQQCCTTTCQQRPTEPDAGVQIAYKEALFLQLELRRVLSAVTLTAGHPRWRSFVWHCRQLDCQAAQSTTKGEDAARQQKQPRQLLARVMLPGHKMCTILCSCVQCCTATSLWCVVLTSVANSRPDSCATVLFCFRHPL